MPSPFPGMDPYLEGHLWPDVHAAIASKIRQQLVPKLRPRYAARLEIYVTEDSSPDEDIGILYPDVQVMSQSMPTQPLPSPALTTSQDTTLKLRLDKALGCGSMD